MEFVVLNENEYAEFYASFEKPCFWQSPMMAHFEEGKGWHAHYVAVRGDDGQTIAAATLLSKHIFLKYDLFKALRGFLIDYDDFELLDFFLTHLKTYLYDHHCLYFEMDPYVEYQIH